MLSECYVKEFGPLKMLNIISGPHTNIFHSAPMERRGLLREVEYFSHQIGDFYLGGWRRNQSNLNQAKREWEVFITCDRTGKNSQVGATIMHRLVKFKGHDRSFLVKPIAIFILLFSIFPLYETN